MRFFRYLFGSTLKEVREKKGPLVDPERAPGQSEAPPASPALEMYIPPTIPTVGAT